MKRVLLAFAFVLGSIALGLQGCGKCRSTGDCDPGEHCEFESGDCLAGCTSDNDCVSRRCDTTSGKCAPELLNLRSDSGTSTTAGDN